MGQNRFLFLSSASGIHLCLLQHTPTCASETMDYSFQQRLLKNPRHCLIFPPFFIVSRNFLPFEKDSLEKNLQEAIWVLINLSMFPQTIQKTAVDKDRMLRVAGVAIHSLLNGLHLWNVKKGGEKMFQRQWQCCVSKFSCWGKHSRQNKETHPYANKILQEETDSGIQSFKEKKIWSIRKCSQCSILPVAQET